MTSRWAWLLGPLTTRQEEEHNWRRIRIRPSTAETKVGAKLAQSEGGTNPHYITTSKQERDLPLPKTEFPRREGESVYLLKGFLSGGNFFFFFFFSSNPN